MPTTTKSPPTPRRPWQPATGADSVQRQTHAAEHIADCLDRIEQHLAAIAAGVEKLTKAAGSKT
jgi:hypothetical protein